MGYVGDMTIAGPERVCDAYCEALQKGIEGVGSTRDDMEWG